MSKFVAAPLLVAALLCSTAEAADYDCPKPETAEALKKADANIADREAAIAEMKSEITDTGGSTDQQKKALEQFEEKLAKAKEGRIKLAAECHDKS